MKKLVAVRLDDPRFSAGPATVVAFPETVADYLAMTKDRDGARDPRMRLWESATSMQVGDRVITQQLDDAFPAC